MRNIQKQIVVAVALGATACVAGSEDAEHAESVPTFEEYAASLPRAQDGAYIVEGDIPVYRREDLTEHYAESTLGTALVIDQDDSGVDEKYTPARALALTYCVSDDFGADKALVEKTFAAAAKEWMDATKIASTDTPTIKLTHVAAEDASCDASNGNVYFDVAPSNDPAFDARSFRPNASRRQREVLITQGAFAQAGQRTFAGVLRHELGHVLGFRHEHINMPGGSCNESFDASWRPVTPYDVPSVMHYRDVKSPSCVNSGSTDYVLTTHDNAGVRCIYTTQARAKSDSAGDACKALTSLSSAATAFAVDANGHVYRMVQSKGVTTIARYIAASTHTTQSWKTLSSASESGTSITQGISAGGSQLYRSTLNTLWRWDSKGWVAIPGGAGHAVVVARATGDLFRLNANGSIDRVMAGKTAVSSILGASAGTVSAGRTLFVGRHELFRLEANGDLYVWTSATGWASSKIGTGIRAVAQTDTGRTFVLLTGKSGTVMARQSSGSWITIGSGASALWGGLEVPYASAIDDPATTLDESKTIARNPSGKTWLQYALRSSAIMKGGNRRIAINVNHRAYVYEAP